MPDYKFDNADKLPPYIFSQINELKSKARSNGEDIIDLGMGNPDQPSPHAVVDKLIETVKNPLTHRYSQSAGIPKLRLAIANWYSRKHGVILDHENEIVTCMGSKEGIAHLSLATLSSDDSVIVQSPTYPIHSYGVVIAGAKLKSVPLKNNLEDFANDIETSILSSVKKPKMIILNFPSNPTTQVADLSFFKRIVEIGKKYDIWIIHDLAYSDIAFDGYKAPSILEIEGAKDIAVEFHSLSKTANMTGWRVGSAAGNPDLINALMRVKSNIDSGLSQAIQEMGMEALALSKDWITENNNIYKNRRDKVVATLQEIGLDAKAPSATLYIWTKVPDGHTSASFTEKLLEEVNVVVTPGSGYGTAGEGYIRLSLTIPDDQIDEGLNRLSKFTLK